MDWRLVIISISYHNFVRDIASYSSNLDLISKLLGVLNHF